MCITPRPNHTAPSGCTGLEAAAVDSIHAWARQVPLVEQRPVHGQRLRDGLVHHPGGVAIHGQRLGDNLE